MALLDLVALSTTVLAQSGAVVTLENTAGLEAADRVIIESMHGYNEQGLDGEWEITGKPDMYYGNAVIGKSFLGTVVSVSGNDVTLDRAVPAGAVGLPCHRNNHESIMHAVNTGATWPANQSFAAASLNTAPMRCFITDTFREIDFRNCEIFAPRGVGALRLGIARLGGGPVSNKHYKNLTLRGNARTSGYGFNAEAGAYLGGQSVPAAFVVGGDNGGVATNVIVENFTFIDNWRSLAIDIASDCIAIDCRSTFTSPLMSYIQWEYLASSAARCVFLRCSVDSNWARASFEPFKSQGISYIQCTARNGAFGSNTSGGVLFKDCGVVWDEVEPNASWSPNNALMIIGRNVENAQGSAQTNAVGGVGVRNFSVRYENIPYPSTDRIFNTITVAPGAYGIATQADIRGVDLRVPRTNLTTPGVGYVVRSDEAETFVSGITGDTLDTSSKYVKQNVVQ